MWFTQVHVFQVLIDIPAENLLEAQLEQLEFMPCKANTPMSSGFIAPIDEDDNYLVHAYRNYLLFCLQIEEKVLPTYVIRQALQAKIKHIEATKQRKVSHKEKYALKDAIYRELLPQAFSRKVKIYAYFDVSNQRLILNTTNPKKTEIFFAMLHKSLSELMIEPFNLKSLPTIMTSWIQKENCPKPFFIEDACFLQNPMLAKKSIRFKGQELFAEGIQLFLQDGYKVMQIALDWHERIKFTLNENLALSTIKFAEKVIAEAKEDTIETAREEFVANFIIMTGTLDHMLNDLLKIFVKKR